MTDPSAQPWPCPECGEAVASCSECVHIHNWYDHVGPSEHMCEWCLRSDYENDPSGLGPFTRA